MKKKYTVLFIFSCILFLFAFSCSNNDKKTVAEGEKLARVHCASCHQFPNPALLDKETWQKGVLPGMAEMMFVETYYDPFNPSGPQGNDPEFRTSPENLFPSDKWEKIVQYYLSAAPEKLPARKEVLQVISKELTQFDSHFLYDIVSYPVTSMVKIDSENQEIIFGDGNSGKLFQISKDLKLLNSVKATVGIADFIRHNNFESVISMGTMRPTDERLGNLSMGNQKSGFKIIIDSLRRPVHAFYADFNGDNKDDIVISEFGFRKGSLSWFENSDNKNYKKHLLKAVPGAIRSEVFDINKDGLPDIITMMAQGDEGVFIFYNFGDGKFREERVLQFPSVYGSNYFQLYDFNKDGFMDILTTNGDNGDNSVILKPYHGIRIFLNNGKNNFTEKIFLPVYGVQKAIPADFDNDGDIDLVSVAFFPDYENHPEEGFIYWENSGDYQYKRYTFEGVADGRWWTMDVADLDKDGDPDIVLGNAFFTMGNVPEKLIQKWKKRPLSLVLLENKLN